MSSWVFWAEVYLQTAVEEQTREQDEAENVSLQKSSGSDSDDVFEHTCWTQSRQLCRWTCAVLWLTELKESVLTSVWRFICSSAVHSCHRSGRAACSRPGQQRAPAEVRRCLNYSVTSSEYSVGAVKWPDSCRWEAGICAESNQNLQNLFKPEMSSLKHPMCLKNRLKLLSNHAFLSKAHHGRLSRVI